MHVNQSLQCNLSDPTQDREQELCCYGAFISYVAFPHGELFYNAVFLLLWHW